MEIPQPLCALTVSIPTGVYGSTLSGRPSFTVTRPLAFATASLADSLDSIVGLVYGANMTSSIYFHRFGTAKDHQFRITRYWERPGIRTWSPANNRQKRAIHFGFGYLSWRIK